MAQVLAPPQHPLRLQQQPFSGAVVALLIGVGGGAAAVQLQVKLIGPHRQCRGQGLEFLQPTAQRAMAIPGQLGMPPPKLHLIHQVLVGTAPMVPHTGQPEAAVDAGAGTPFPMGLPDRPWVPCATESAWQQRQHFGATGVTPAEQAVGEGVTGIPTELGGQKPADALAQQGLGETCGEAEAIRQPGQVMAPLGEVLSTPALPRLQLA